MCKHYEPPPLLKYKGSCGKDGSINISDDGLCESFEYSEEAKQEYLNFCKADLERAGYKVIKDE